MLGDRVKSESAVFEALVAPFAELMDDRLEALELVDESLYDADAYAAEKHRMEQGLLRFEDMIVGLSQVGCMLSRFDALVVAKYYSVEGNPDLLDREEVKRRARQAKEDQRREQQNNIGEPLVSVHLSTERDSGHRFDSWLQQRGLRSSASAPPAASTANALASDEANDRRRTLQTMMSTLSSSKAEQTDMHIYLVPLISRMAEIIWSALDDGDHDDATLLNNRVSSSTASSSAFASRVNDTVQWSARNFDLIDELLTQLSRLKTSERRRNLLTLESLLREADRRHTGDVDGFTVLSALMHAQFKLPKQQRTRILREVEDLGGLFHYAEFCQILMQSCADWTLNEKQIVRKVLKAMGLTVPERRTWIARVRLTLQRKAKHSGMCMSMMTRMMMRQTL